MPTNKPHFSITVDDELFDEIENFRYENRFPNRNQALVALIKEGLKKTSDKDAKVLADGAQSDMVKRSKDKMKKPDSA